MLTRTGEPAVAAIQLAKDLVDGKRSLRFIPTTSHLLPGGPLPRLD